MLDLLGKYIQAFGLLSTLKGDMVIDVDNPMCMAEELYAHLRPRAQGALGPRAQGALVLGVVDSYKIEEQENQWRLMVRTANVAPSSSFGEVTSIHFSDKDGTAVDFQGVYVINTNQITLPSGSVELVIYFRGIRHDKKDRSPNGTLDQVDKENGDHDTLDLGLVESYTTDDGVSGKRRLLVVTPKHAPLVGVYGKTAIKLHFAGGDTLEFAKLCILTAYERPLKSGRMEYTIDFTYTHKDQGPEVSSGPLALGPICNIELNGSGALGHTGNWKLTCRERGGWKPSTMNCTEINEVSFVTPKGQFYHFMDVSMRCMKDTEDDLELYFHGTKVKP